VDQALTIDTTTALTDITLVSNPRSVASTNGTDLWLSGGSSGASGTGVRYTTYGSTTATDLTSTTLNNVRAVAIFGGQLYLSSGSGTNTFKGVDTVGTGLPTSGAQTVTRLLGLSDAVNPSTYGFFLADLSADVAGVDTLYMADDDTTTQGGVGVGGLKKFSLVNGTWVSNGTVGAGANKYRGLTGSVNGTSVTLFIIQNALDLAVLTDASGYNGAFAGTPTVVTSAGTNTAFRGVALTPVGVYPTCPASLTTTSGTATSGPVSATAPSGTFDNSSAAITSSAVTGITLSDVAGTTGSISATLNVSAATAVGTYQVEITFTDTSVPAMNAKCTVPVTVSTLDLQPSVQSITPDLTKIVPENSAFAITFSEAVTVTEPWYSLTCNSTPVPSGVVPNGENTVFTITPTAPLPLNAACSLELTPANIVDSASQALTGTSQWSFNTSQCSTSYKKIHEIQGSGMFAALTGLQTTQGVVTAKMPGMNGFYMQSNPNIAGEDDGNPATSEGLFVYSASLAASLNVGDYIRISGTASDYRSAGGSYGQFYDTTQLSGTVTLVETCATGVTITPAPINLPADTNPVAEQTADAGMGLERFEGMLVSFPGKYTVEQNYFQGRFGQLTLGTQRIFNPTSILTGMDYATSARHMFVLDDGNTGQNPNPIPFYDGLNGLPRAGDMVSNLVGVLDQGKINSTFTTNTVTYGFPTVYYRLEPTLTPSFERANPRPVAAPAVGGRLTVAGFNVLNYFTTLDNASAANYAVCGYGTGNTPRGADTAAEFTRQQDKLVAALKMIDADVVGLTELESCPQANALNSLVAALNAATAPGTYAAIGAPDNGYGGDSIKQDILYKVAKVTPVGGAKSPLDAAAVFKRKPVAQTFMEIATREKFTVVVNHFKSKGCDASATGGNADPGGGVGCYNQERVDSANALIDFIQTTLKPVDPDVVALGDLNAYGIEEPILTLQSRGLVNQMLKVANNRYTYVFDGMAGYLDHNLTTASLNGQVTGVGVLHINADEPSVIDYNTEFKPQDLYAANAYRSADHDPVIIGLDLLSYQYRFPIILN
jgi:predicted extracellular nuclease